MIDIFEQPKNRRKICDGIDRFYDAVLLGQSLKKKYGFIALLIKKLVNGRETIDTNCSKVLKSPYASHKKLFFVEGIMRRISKIVAFLLVICLCVQ